MSPSRNIALVVDSLKPGGSERVASEMANYWARGGHRVSLITLKKEPPFYELEKGVRLEELDVASGSAHLLAGLYNTYRRIRVLRERLKKLNPEVVIGFFTDINVLLVLATRGLGMAVILTERNHPGLHLVPLRWRIMRRRVYPLADCLVLQTSGAARWFSHYRVRRAVIPNPVREVRAAADRGKPYILAVGRLTRQKGFDLLLKAYARSGLYPRWSLVVVGEGGERKSLEKLASRLGVVDGVHMPGLVKNIDHYFSEASFFVLSSRYEGFPNALAEAMSAGLPPVAFDCPYGPAEMIDHGENGFLVRAGDVESLARNMIDMADNPGMAQEMGQQAAASVRGRLKQQAIMKQWDELAEELLAP